MSDDSVRDRGALWHFREASRYASQASYTRHDPEVVELWHNEVVNPELQAHYREMAQLHATLFVGLTQVLSGGAHSSARAVLAAIAGGESDPADPKSSMPFEG